MFVLVEGRSEGLVRASDATTASSVVVGLDSSGERESEGLNARALLTVANGADVFSKRIRRPVDMGPQRRVATLDSPCTWHRDGLGHGQEPCVASPAHFAGALTALLTGRAAYRPRHLSVDYPTSLAFPFHFVSIHFTT